MVRGARVDTYPQELKNVTKTWWSEDWIMGRGARGREEEEGLGDSLEGVGIQGKEDGGGRGALLSPPSSPSYLSTETFTKSW